MKARGIAAMAASAPLVPFEFERRELGSRDVALNVSY
ncbi:MAG: NAD(P)-dependent alcohol dehydrogenase, partial [Actinobacteria bacterium]|nr:NAD(P)-dependent alcohol dehydrogenase [Actinomycetota bacterium]